MSGAGMLDKTFEVVMRQMVETGQAPHYTEIAKQLGLSMEEGRQAVHKLFSAGVPGWLFPNTSLIIQSALRRQESRGPIFEKIFRNRTMTTGAGTCRYASRIRRMSGFLNRSSRFNEPVEQGI